MGGDDLGSEDEFLAAPIRVDQSGASSDDESVPARTSQSNELPGLTSDKEDIAPPSKKRKRVGKDPLRDIGLGITTAPLETQAKLISEFANVKFQPHQLSRSEVGDAPGAMKRVQGIVSKKRLKKWKTKESPCVLIVCISARRAVQILKELAPFNVRVAKLFAKHITIEEQCKQLEESAFGIAVGTPHRLLALIQEGALSLESTQYIMLDSFMNDKRFSVYTLPDTAVHTKELLREHVQDQVSKRKDMRLAFI